MGRRVGNEKLWKESEEVRKIRVGRKERDGREWDEEEERTRKGKRRWLEENEEEEE